MNRETAKALAQRYRDLNPGSTVRVVKQTTANGSLNGATYGVVCDRWTLISFAVGPADAPEFQS